MDGSAVPRLGVVSLVRSMDEVEVTERGQKSATHAVQANAVELARVRAAHDELVTTMTAALTLAEHVLALAKQQGEHPRTWVQRTLEKKAARLVEMLQARLP
jgi:hypothetical protein